MNKINMFWKAVILKRHLCFYNYVYQNQVGMIPGLINSMPSPGICDPDQGHGEPGTWFFSFWFFPSPYMSPSFILTTVPSS